MSDKQYTDNPAVSDDTIYATVTQDGRVTKNSADSKPDLPDFHDDFRVRTADPNIPTLSNVFDQTRLLIAIANRGDEYEIEIVPKDRVTVAPQEHGFLLEHNARTRVSDATDRHFQEVLSVRKHQLTDTEPLRLEESVPGARGTEIYPFVDDTRDVIEHLQRILNNESKPDVFGTAPSGSWMYAWARSFGLYAPIGSNIKAQMSTNFTVEWPGNGVLMYSSGETDIRERQNGLHVSNIQIVSEDDVPDTSEEAITCTYSDITGPERHR